MNEKVTLEWYASKECPKYERYYDGSVGSQLLFKAYNTVSGVECENLQMK